MPEHKLRLEALIDFQPEKWGLIFKVLVFNAVIVSAVLGVLAVLGQFENIQQFNTGSAQAYFNKLSLANLWIFFKQYCLRGPTEEEMIYRLPVSLLIFWNLQWFLGSKDITKYALWLALIIPTVFWALEHRPFPLPVLISGLTYGWLIIKTRHIWPWPAVVCHSLSNLSLYILVKILQIFEYAPINIPK